MTKEQIQAMREKMEKYNQLRLDLDVIASLLNLKRNMLNNVFCASIVHNGHEFKWKSDQIETAICAALLADQERIEAEMEAL